MAKLNAKPEPVEFALERSAMIVVDIRNAFASEGVAGADLSEAPRVVQTIRSVADAARAAEVPVGHGF